MDFIILKVNGVDVSTFSTEEASLAFQNAAEPIVVQVLRRSANSNKEAASPVSTPSPTTTLNRACFAGASCCLHGSGNNNGTTSTTSTQTEWTSMANMTDHGVDGLDLLEAMYDPQDSDELFDELMDQEMEYEEVRLVRDNNQDKLGLTLCYTTVTPLLLNTDNPGMAPAIEDESSSLVGGNDNGSPSPPRICEDGEGETKEAQAEEDVYIKEIAPNSVATLDGRLKAGDQILQIDGEDVRNRATAERLFAEARSEILLLVSRPHQSPHPLETLPGGAEDDEDVYFVEKSPLDLQEDLGVMENESHKDSGFGTGSLPKEEAFSSEVDESGEKEVSVCTIQTQPKTWDKTSPDSVHQATNSLEQAGGKQALLPGTRSDSVLSLDTELYMLNKKMQDIQLECESMVARQQQQQQAHLHTPDADVVSPPESPEKKNSPWGESETEHIYETIHELTEESDEPIYSTPYEVEIARQRAFQRQQQLLLANLNSSSNNASRTNTNSWNTKSRTVEPKKFTLDKKLSRGFEKMDKTQDVEHWIRHSTVISQPPEEPGQNSKGVKSSKLEDFYKPALIPSCQSPVKNSGKSSGKLTNERSWKGTNSTKVSSASSSGDSNPRKDSAPVNNCGHQDNTPHAIPIISIANRVRKHGSKGSASSGSGEDRDSSSAYNTGTGESFRSQQIVPANLDDTSSKMAGHASMHDNMTNGERAPCSQCEKAKDWRQSNLSLSVSLGGKSDNPMAESGKLLANFKINMEDRALQANLDSEACSVFSCDSCMRCSGFPPPPPLSSFNNANSTTSKTSSRPTRFSDMKPRSSRSAGNNGGVSDSLERNRNYVTMLPAHTMYTNAENLQQTIWLQQQLFKQKLQQQQHHSSQADLPNKIHRSSSNGRHGPVSMDTIIEDAPMTPASVRSLGKHTPALFPKLNFSHYQYVSTPSEGVQTPLMDKKGNFVGHVNGYPHPNGSGMEDLPLGMEWKVKKRTDGTRYITRKPARTRVLRDRALQINEERAGITTDDDAMSEMKTGRYWSKDEKKEHLEKARERRKHQEEVIRAKMRGYYSNPPNDTGSSSPRNINIVELSHRKMAAIARQRRDNQIDDFTTVQEMLVHGNRVGQGLLSVTTV